ncbi:MAG: lipoyl synthase [Armatimonadetes bacterium]|nr:lipoyl synthase [Armatimonadota bacterium]
MMTDGSRRPPWLKVRLPGGENYADLARIMRRRGMHTVCEEARCPNIGECWERRTATFLILGDTCTRRCWYCAVAHGRPGAPDEGEPARVADAAAAMGLRHAVVTSVNRDDLKDGGAGTYAATIRAIRRELPGCTVEVLVPDFKGDPEALRAVLEAGPEILGHNLEAVRRVFASVRPGGNYDRSLELLRRCKEWGYNPFTKSGIIVGMGETEDELLDAMDDLRSVDCDVLTLGQYLRPGGDFLPIARYYAPEEFAELRDEGLRRGFRYVEAGPLVRSSYRADAQAQAVRAYNAPPLAAGGFPR